MFRGKGLALLIVSLLVILVGAVYSLTRRQHSANGTSLVLGGSWRQRNQKGRAVGWLDGRRLVAGDHAFARGGGGSRSVPIIEFAGYGSGLVNRRGSPARNVTLRNIDPDVLALGEGQEGDACSIR